MEDPEVPLDESIDTPLATHELLTLLRASVDSRENLIDEAIRCVQQQTIDEGGPSEDPIYRLLRFVIKPLFSAPNPTLTAAGRKNEYQNSPANIGGNRWDPSTYSDSTKPWKVQGSWSLPLLTWVVHQIHHLVTTDHVTNAPAPDHPSAVGKQVVGPRGDAETLLADLTPLLAPPILHLIDDSSLASKAVGASLLKEFSSAHSAVQKSALSLQTPTAAKPKASIFARTGLASVFIDALTPNLSLLPSLTPEEESIFILRRIYPAYIAVVDAAYPPPPPPSTLSSAAAIQHPSSLSYTTHLTPVLPQLLTSLTHLSDSHPALQALLLTQLSHLIRLLGISVASYLHPILVHCRETLCNPFGAVDANLVVLQACVTVCVDVCNAVPQRIYYHHPPHHHEGDEDEDQSHSGSGSGWWPEILRGILGAWINLHHDPSSSLSSTSSSNKSTLFVQLKSLVHLLRDLVRRSRRPDGNKDDDDDNEFTNAIKSILDEDEDGGLFLRDLFDDIPDRYLSGTGVGTE